MPSRLHEQLQTVLGPAYAIERELGGGGMSRVFVAEDTALERRVVVKVLPPELSSDVSTERFQREVRLAAKLQHPHIVPLLSAGKAGELLYYTMPFVEGESLRERLAREGRLAVVDAVRIARDVAAALTHAHSRGIVHRDIKPDNVLLTVGYALVTDFGIAKALDVPAMTGGSPLTGAAVAIGTPSYMAPEQVAADPNVDHRADIYALGTLLYEMLAGRPPFAGAVPHVVLAAQVSDSPKPLTKHCPTVPRHLAVLVMRCLEKRPVDRPQSADEVLRELEAFATPGAIEGGRRVIHLRLPHRRLAAVSGVSAVIVLGLGVLGYTGARLRRDARAAVHHSATGPVTAAGRAPDPTGAYSASIAVLPLVNMSGEQETEYFSDGMTEELITALSKVQGLKVVARTSVFALKGKAVDVRTIGDTLGVATVLEGSVRRAGDRLRVTVQLVNAADGYHVWSETYDREIRDVFAVQDELARAITSALGVRLVQSRRVPLVRRSTANIEAYDLYLRGRYHFLNWMGSMEEQRLTRALNFFEEALRKDSSFAPAYAGIADVYGWLMDDFLPPRVAARKGIPAAKRAVALDSTLAEAHVSLWGWLGWERDLVSAERAIRRAIELSPGSSWAHQMYGFFLGSLGRSEESIREAKLARDLDPLSIWAATFLGDAYSKARQYDRAVDQYRFTISLDSSHAPAHGGLGLVYLMQGRFPEALVELKQAAVLSGGHPRPLAILAYAHGVAGDRPAARRQLAQLEAISRRRYVSPDFFAWVHIGLGNTDQAFAWLDKAVQVRSSFVWTEPKTNPMYDPIRSDPRYPRLLRRVGLE